MLLCTGQVPKLPGWGFGASWSGREECGLLWVSTLASVGLSTVAPGPGCGCPSTGTAAAVAVRQSCPWPWPRGSPVCGRGAQLLRPRPAPRAGHPYPPAGVCAPLWDEGTVSTFPGASGPPAEAALGSVCPLATCTPQRGRASQDCGLPEVAAKNPGKRPSSQLPQRCQLMPAHQWS